MNLSTRNNRIFRLRDKGLTLKEISDDTGITSERVRQIIQRRGHQYCSVHNIYSENKCSRCNIKENYVAKIKQIAANNLMDEVARLSKPDRQKEVVVQRQALIKLLKDDYGFSYFEIARLLERDHTSISYLYNKPINI